VTYDSLHTSLQDTAATFMYVYTMCAYVDHQSSVDSQATVNWLSAHSQVFMTSKCQNLNVACTTVSQRKVNIAAIVTLDTL
jgi:hypothetical protein